YSDVANLQLINHRLQNVSQVAILALFNFIAFYSWLISYDNKKPSIASKLFNRINPKKSTTDITANDVKHPLNNSKINSSQTKSSLHWSTYVVGLLSTFFMTYLAIVTVFDNGNIWATLIAIIVWLGWCGFMFWQFYLRRIDLLMLTYLSFSIITVVMFWVGKWLLEGFDAGGFLILALLLIGMSSSAVMWLRKIACIKNDDTAPHTVIKGNSDEQ